MKYSIAFGTLLAILPCVHSQSGAYGQCGGTGWTGATTCVAGYTCTYSNPYYSQCEPGTATSASSKTTSTTTTTKASTTTTKGTTTTTTAGATGTSGAVLTGQWATESECAGYYTLENNQWGISGYTGSQTAQETGCSGTTVAWHTTYTWTGGPYQVKTYTNMNLNMGLQKTLASIKSIPTTWDWTYTTASSDLVADVSYDLWLSTTPNTYGASSTSSYEIMIWLSARGGAGPAGSQIATVTVDGISWKLSKGTVSTWTVFSFVPVSGELTTFSQDLLPFFNYLIASQGVSSSQYLVQAQSGTEPFISSQTTTLTTTGYSLTVN